MLASLLHSFLDTHSLSTSSLVCKPMCIVNNFLVFLVNLSWFFPCPFQELPRVSYKRDYSDVYPFDDISAAVLGFEKFFCLSEVFFFSFFLFSFFLHLHLFDGISFHYFQVHIIFLFSKCSDSFLICQFFSFRFLYFSTFLYEHCTFFYAKFYSYILSLQFFFIFCK